MAGDKSGQEWVQPVIAGISLTSGVISLAVFALQVVPGGLASALVAAAGLTLAAAGLLALKRGRILKHALRKAERFAAWPSSGCAF